MSNDGVNAGRRRAGSGHPVVGAAAVGAAVHRTWFPPLKPPEHPR
jgi:hypothetical protein